MSHAGEDELVTEAAGLLAEARRVAVFTGAGVSTESGIPDFRSPGGIWSNYAPVRFQEFVASEEARQRAWRFILSLYEMIDRAVPNPAHRAVAELEELGCLEAVITQNVDGLHQRAGVSADRVVELHGNVRWVGCLECGHLYPRPEIERRVRAGDLAPRCGRCGGILKSATISFGQPMPVEALQRAEQAARSCDLLLSVGSSLVVYPAAGIPAVAKGMGARLLIVNQAATPLDGAADLLLRGRAGELLPRVIAQARVLRRALARA